MIRIPMVKSKLTVPQPPHSVVISERIKKLIHLMHKKKAVIIAAPSGYGKTTLMTASLTLFNEKRDRICWYRLEKEDQEISVFYAYLTEALFPSDDPQLEESRRALELFADHQSQYRYINAIICQELWSYSSKHPDVRTFIAFDDFHNVEDSPEISETVAYLICNLPDNYTVLLSSRQPIDILSEKQKLEKNILEIGQMDLCFIEKEISQLLMNTCEISASKKLMKRIISNTEGWVAGIVMICQILSNSDTADAESFLEKPWQKTKLFKYMTSEVLKSVQPEMLQFLVKAAILQDFTLEEAEMILNVQNSAQLLLQCEKKGLFIQIVVQDNITYRFHSLFRDALRQLQPEYMTAEEIQSLNHKAAAYYIEHRLFSRAIEQFILCGVIDSAVELITRESVTLITFEAIEQLRVWLNLLPEDVVEENPSLLYIKSFTYQQGKDNQMIPMMEKAFSRFQEVNNPIMSVYSLVSLIHYYMFTNDITKLLYSISQAISILEKDIKGDQSKYMSDVLLFTRAVYEENFSAATALLKDLRYSGLDEDWKWVVLAHSCMLGYLTGALDEAESAIKEGFQNTLVKRGEFFRALAYTYYCTVLYLKNDSTALVSAENHLMAIGEKYEYNFMLGFEKRASAYRKYAAHDLESALELLNISNKHFEQYGNAVIPLLNNLCSLLWLSHQKNPEELLSEAEIVFQDVSVTHPGFCILDICQSLFGAIARECKEYKLAEEYLLAAIHASEKKGSKQILCGSYLHLAKLYFDTGEGDKAGKLLKKAFALASENKYSMFWDIHIPTLTEMAMHCIKADIYAKYAWGLLSSYFNPEAVSYIEKNLNGIDDASLKELSERVLSRYAEADCMDLPYSIDIRFFGKFCISINGAPISEDEWKTKKIKGLLKYLILNKGKVVTRSRLMEMFWPDSDEKSAAASLRAALYELKKVLAKYGILNDGDMTFIHEKSGSIEVRPNNMLSVDIDKFVSLYDEYKSEYKKGINLKHLLPLLEEICNTYSGDLLYDEMYSDWAFVEREAYKSIFQEMAATLALVYIEAKEIHKAEILLLKVLSIDPYNEKACLDLLNLYVSANQRGRAAKLYSEFEKRLINDLNIKPDEKLSISARNI